MGLNLLMGFIGFSEGVMVGTALIAFLTILDIVPRLAQLTSTEEHVKIYEITIGITVTLISLGSALDLSIDIGKIMVICVGFLMGTFIGLLASALTEVTNVIPVVINRFQIHPYIKLVFFSLAGGKMVGSFIYWVFVNK
ncbi:stage V sporulation protein AB [Inediibacterium massiliense]|uniref:stage V sporulation protein AB n=1 Tax=Inediibacterium massiliense TaxID=1658111 RepID=UPI0006B60855|nr:stage V sporulation protein AB [Inediibacterium massiliense]